MSISSELEKKYGVSRAGLDKEGYASWAENNPKGYLLLCEFGGRRSPYAAMEASELGLPSLFLIGGLNGVLAVRIFESIYNLAVDGINRAPRIGVILPREEQLRYRAILGKLQRAEYFDTQENFVGKINSELSYR